MPETITAGGKTYHHYSLLTVDADSPLRDQGEDRQAFFDRRKLPLDRTAGAFVELGGRPVLLVIDERTIGYRSEEWMMIAKIAAHLDHCYSRLTQQARDALSLLVAIVFSGIPDRSFAEVEPQLFIYNVKEFRRRDRTFVDPAWCASCVVHDANHIWQHRARSPWHGVNAEVACWELQIDNKVPLALSDTDADWIRTFLADPEKIVGRAESDPFRRFVSFVRRLWSPARTGTSCSFPPPPARSPESTVGQDRPNSPEE